jgi:hypothetical protein
MAITLTNTETVRDDIGSTLSAALVGDGNALQAFYGYEEDDFGGQSPVLLLTTAANDVDERTAGEIPTQTMKFLLMLFVLFKGNNWTPADCEDKLNECYKAIVETLLENAHQTSPANYSIYMDGQADIVPANVGGIDYRMQPIPIRVEVYDT